MATNLIYVGVKAHVAALDQATGTIVWKTQLKSGMTGGARFVSLLVDGARVYAHTHGALFCLDARNGNVLWSNDLAGLSYDIATLATATATTSSVPAMNYLHEQLRSNQAAAGSATGGH